MLLLELLLITRRLVLRTLDFSSPFVLVIVLCRIVLIYELSVSGLRAFINTISFSLITHAVMLIFLLIRYSTASLIPSRLVLDLIIYKS